MRYAQEYAGQKLHLAEEIDPDLNAGRTVADRALCGRTNANRGAWRLTINVALGNVCRNCRRIRNRQLTRALRGER